MQWSILWQFYSDIKVTVELRLNGLATLNRPQTFLFNLTPRIQYGSFDPLECSMLWTLAEMLTWRIYLYESDISNGKTLAESVHEMVGEDIG
ncbi:hypothetical protein TNCV_841141 [Trichonephila clavipes]|nr:hypothetical protein TNCV_841141 [Trichonephila clavipes]